MSSVRHSYPGRVIFDHLPKTAGSAINSWLQSMLGTGCVTTNLIGNHLELIKSHGGNFSIISGHVAFFGEGLDPRYQYVTCLREPLDMALSSLFFALKNHSENQLPDIWRDARRFVDSDGDVIGPSIVSNAQVEHFAAINAGPSITDADKLEKALSAVEQYSVWGLYEAMPDFLTDFADLIGVPAPGSIARANVTMGRPAVSAISPKLSARLCELNALDIEFYRILRSRYARARLGCKRSVTARSQWTPFERTENRLFTTAEFALIDVALDGGSNWASGSSISFKLVYSLASEVSELEIGIHLIDENGRRAFGTNTTILGQPVVRLMAGTHSTHYSVRADLPEGEYTAGFAFIERTAHGTRELAWYEKLISFRIRLQRASPCVGYVNLPAAVASHQIGDRITRLVLDAKGAMRRNAPPGARALDHMAVGDKQTIHAVLINDSVQDWTSQWLHPINLSYRWRDDLDNVAGLEGGRAPLPNGSLNAGESVAVALTVIAPDIPGIYKLCVLPVQEGVAWFDELGFAPLEIEVTVVVAVLDSNPRPHSMSTQERVRMTLSCHDSEAIPKGSNAGTIASGDGRLIQMMHDGTKVLAGGYHGSWMQEIITDLRGHHEPQEELLFHTLLNHVQPNSLMVELGCFWAYYSNWYLGAIPGSRAICVEPDENNLNVGRENMALNNRKADFFLAAAGGKYQSNFTFHRESDDKQVNIEVWDYPMLADVTHTECIEILHMDVQGAELPFLQSIARAPYQGKLRFVVVSTHHESISGSPTTHRDCLHVLINLGAVVLCEHSIEESFSGDGLIIASFSPADAAIALPPISRNAPESSLFGPAPSRRVQAATTGSISATAARLVNDTEDGIELVPTDFGPMKIFKADSVIGAALKSTGSFQTDSIRAVVEFLRLHHQFVPQTFFDIGANIGTHLVCALQPGLFAKAVGFEPDPANFALLASNVDQNGLADKARIFQLALSNRSGATLFELCGSNYGDHRVRVAGHTAPVSLGEDQRRVISVLTDRGDDFLAEHGLVLEPNCLVWVDTQGHEGHVLNGLQDQINNAEQIYIVCEFWPYGLERAGGKRLFFDFLKGFQKIYDINSVNWQIGPGFNLEQLEEGYQAMLKDTRADHYPHTDLLCIKNVSGS